MIPLPSGLENRQEETNKALNCNTLATLFPKTIYLNLNVFTVYFCQYTIITSFANVLDYKMKAKYPELEGTVRIENFYVILNMCYHLGVFFSRSSLSLVRIKKVWILSGF